MTDPSRIGGAIIRGGLSLLSLSTFGVLLLAIFAVDTGLLALSAIAPVLGALFAVVTLRYVALYHRFSRSAYRLALLVPATAAVVVTGGLTYRALVPAVTWAELRRVVETTPTDPTYQSFLPEWWLGVALLAAGALALFGALRTRDTGPYPKPTDIREIARSPVFFGLGCTVFGLWAVLFVGVGVQRIVVIAPIFEEALKFGVALLIGASLFGRSIAGRVAVAAVVGLLFGVIEHATTYPTEADAIYLYRSLFHMAAPMLSVSVYTRFESTDRNDLRWIAPVLPMLFHFFYNTFAVLSSLILFVAFGSQSTVPTLIYGSLTVLCIAVLLLLSWLRQSVVRALYEPFADVLSDLA